MSFKAEAILEGMGKGLNDSICDNVGVVFQFDLTNASGVERSWVVDAKNKPGFLKDGKSDAATCTIVVGDEDFCKLISGELNGMQAFMEGKMKIKGDMMAAQKLENLREDKSKL
eukprot:NODE_2468_length_533_cov_145.964876_g1961_i0.p1 GENE.NODE_2468_length_533_cov_145.964876_g1961_i0~~NODE_2468_length_533_cov_145.964876_g1961_i0.p1  ORF type:complete len:114 (+),score=25.97 NODE_2468_length_533_cov_145.964876_g1961_i0:64-405(+)